MASFFQEFKFLRPTSSVSHFIANRKQDNKTDSQSDAGTQRYKYFEEYSGATTPFNVQAELDGKEDVFAGIGVREVTLV